MLNFPKLNNIITENLNDVEFATLYQEEKQTFKNELVAYKQYEKVSNGKARSIAKKPQVKFIQNTSLLDNKHS